MIARGNMIVRGKYGYLAWMKHSVDPDQLAS